MIEIHTEPDGVGDGIEEALRGGVAVATAAGRHLANLRVQAMRDAALADRERASELQGRLAVERAAMHAQLKSVDSPAWWEAARAPEILEAWTLATSWSDTDPTAAAAANTIRGQFTDRYRIDLDEVTRPGELSMPTGTPDALAAAIRDYRISRGVVEASGQEPIADMVAKGGPPTPPRPRKATAQRTASRETERAR